MLNLNKWLKFLSTLMVKPINSIIGFEKELGQNINFIIDKY
tara:strand:+ start:455 stop:577 length:123 start_codon:yes stop_codon:yes gene_type:complete